MSKNYNKYYNSNNYSKHEFKPEESTKVEESEVLEDGIDVESILELVIDPDITRAATTDLPMEENGAMPEPLVYGINNCKKLNVRTEPDKEASLVCVLDSTSKFEIEELESNPEWVKVLLENGEVGFCMKMYVAIR